MKTNEKAQISPEFFKITFIIHSKAWIICLSRVIYSLIKTDKNFTILEI